MDPATQPDTPNPPLTREEAFNRLKNLQDTSLKIWTLYIQWYTWFVGVSLLTLGWFVANAEKINVDLGHATAAFMSIASILGICGAWMVTRYDRIARPATEALTQTAATPSNVTIAAGRASKKLTCLMGGALFVLALTWVYTAVRMGPAHEQAIEDAKCVKSETACPKVPTTKP